MQCKDRSRRKMHAITIIVTASDSMRKGTPQARPMIAPMLMPKRKETKAAVILIFDSELRVQEYGKMYKHIVLTPNC